MSAPIAWKNWLAFAIQADMETVNVTPADFVFVPLTTDESLKTNKNYSFDVGVEGFAGPNKFYSQGEIVEGGVAITMVPGATADLVDWMITRDADGQGKFATVIINTPALRRRFTGCKIDTARLVFESKNLLAADLSLVGKFEDSDASPTLTPSWAVDNPYMFADCALEVGGSADLTFNRVELTVNNHVDKECFRLNGTGKPEVFYNLGGPDCEGTFERDAVDSVIYAAFMAGTSGSMTVTAERTIGEDTYSVAFEMKKIIYTESGLHAKGQRNARNVNTGTFTAMSGVEVATPFAPIAITDTAPAAG